MAKSLAVLGVTWEALCSAAFPLFWNEMNTWPLVRRLGDRKKATPSGRGAGYRGKSFCHLRQMSHTQMLLDFAGCDAVGGTAALCPHLQEGLRGQVSPQHTSFLCFLFLFFWLHPRHVLWLNPRHSSVYARSLTHRATGELLLPPLYCMSFMGWTWLQWSPIHSYGSFARQATAKKQGRR